MLIRFVTVLSQILDPMWQTKAKTNIRICFRQVLLVLVRIQPYFLIAFCITYGLINVHFVQPEFSLTMAIIPASAIVVLMTVIFVRSENTFGAVAVIVR